MGDRARFLSAGGERAMMKVALTGNVASGKSTVAGIWEGAGVPVIRADVLAREVVAPGTEGLAAVVEAFGREVLAPDGSLDRGRMGSRVFSDPEARRRLESILHPLIRARRDGQLARLREAGLRLVVAEIPLLFETGTEGEYEVVVMVDASEEERLRRLVEDRAMDPAEARRIMAAQMPAGTKRERAHYVLENEGTVEDLRTRALALLDLLRARGRRGAAP